MKDSTLDDLIILLDSRNVVDAEQDRRIELDKWNLDKIDNTHDNLDGNYNYDFTGKTLMLI